MKPNMTSNTTRENMVSDIENNPDQLNAASIFVDENIRDGSSFSKA